MTAAKTAVSGLLKQLFASAVAADAWWRGYQSSLVASELS